jgi:hypothetical protein
MAPSPSARFARLVYAGAAAVAAGWLLLTSLPKVDRFARGPGTDLVVDWGGAHILLAGGDPYRPADLERTGVRAALDELGVKAPRGLAHPPTAFVWLLPLGGGDLASAKAVWNLLTLLLTFLLVGAVVVELRLPAPLATVPLVLGLLLSAELYQLHLYLGQLAILIAFLLVLAWLASRRGADLAAGVALGLACTLKPFPGYVILLFLLARRFRVVAGAAAAWLAVALPVTIRLGPRTWLAFLAESRRYTAEWIGSIQNASFVGILQRLRHPICETPRATHEVWLPATLLGLAVTLGLIVLIGRLGRRALAEGRIDLPFAAACAVAMLGGPYAWEHYNVTLILPIGVAVAILLRPGEPWALRAAGGGVLAVACWLLGLGVLDKYRMWSAYPAHHELHLALHLREIATVAPAFLVIGLLLVLLRREARACGHAGSC